MHDKSLEKVLQDFIALLSRYDENDLEKLEVLSNELETFIDTHDSCCSYKTLNTHFFVIGGVRLPYYYTIRYAYFAALRLLHQKAA